MKKRGIINFHGMDAIKEVGFDQRIAEVILCFPLELCQIVSEYALPNVRWLGSQLNPTIEVHDDKCSAQLMKAHYEDFQEEIEGFAYYEVVAEDALCRTAKKWTIMFSSLDIGIKCLLFGVQRNGKRFLSPRLFLDNGRLGWYNHVSFKDFPKGTVQRSTAYSQETVRFSLSADIKAGSLKTRIWSTKDEFAPVDDWFTMKIDPEVLGSSVPVVYLFGNGTMATLI